MIYEVQQTGEIMEKKEEKLPKHQASPEMTKFFNRLSELKQHIKHKYEETKDENIGEIFQKLNNMFKIKGE